MIMVTVFNRSYLGPSTQTTLRVYLVRSANSQLGMLLTQSVGVLGSRLASARTRSWEAGWGEGNFRAPRPGAEHEFVEQ